MQYLKKKKLFFPLPQSSCPADSDLFTIFCPRLIFFSLFLRHYRLSLSRLSVVLRHRHHPHLRTRTNISKQTSRAKKKSPTCRPTFFSRFVVICSSTQNVSLLLSCQRLHFLTFFTLSSLPPSSTTPKCAEESVTFKGRRRRRASWMRNRGNSSTFNDDKFALFPSPLLFSLSSLWHPRREGKKWSWKMKMKCRRWRDDKRSGFTEKTAQGSACN